MAKEARKPAFLFRYSLFAPSAEGSSGGAFIRGNIGPIWNRAGSHVV